MIDLTNKIFDRLMVIEKSGQYIVPSGCKEPTWLCICECGNKCIVRGSQLRSGIKNGWNIGRALNYE